MNAFEAAGYGDDKPYESPIAAKLDGYAVGHDVVAEEPPIYTVGYTYMKIFDTPGCRNPLRDDSRQY